MGYGIPNCRADGSGRKHRVGRETLAPERTEMPQVRGGQTTRAGVAADRPERVEGVPLPVRSDLQSVYRHGVGPAASEAGSGRVAAEGHFQRRANRRAITGIGRWLRGAANLAPRAASAG